MLLLGRRHHDHEPGALRMVALHPIPDPDTAPVILDQLFNKV